MPDMVVQRRLDGIDALDELGAEYHGPGLGRLGAASNGFGHEAEIERHGPGPGAQDPEIDREPLEAVHHQVHHALARLDTPHHKRLGHFVGQAVEVAPVDLRAFAFGRSPFDQGGLVAVHACIAGQDFGNDHRLDSCV